MPLTPLPGFSCLFAPHSTPVISAVEAVGVKQMLAKDMRGGMPAAHNFLSSLDAFRPNDATRDSLGLHFATTYAPVDVVTSNFRACALSHLHAEANAPP
jgi:hypothetical protein